MDFMYRKCYFINQKDFISSDDDNQNKGPNCFSHFSCWTNFEFFYFRTQIAAAAAFKWEIEKLSLVWSVNFGDSRKRNWSGEFLRLAAPCDQKQWRERDQPGQKRNRDRHSTESERSLNDFLLFLFTFKIKFCTKTWEKGFLYFACCEYGFEYLA